MDLFSDSLKLVPKHALSENLQGLIKKARPRHNAEILYLIPNSDEDILLELLNIVTRTSEMAHMNYFNLAKQEMRPLIGESVRVEKIGGEAVDDIPRFSRLQDAEFIQRQYLSSFSEVQSTVQIFAAEEAFLYHTFNLTRITRSGILAILPRRMHSTLLAVRSDEGDIVLYLASGIRSIDIFGIFKNMVENSFTSRALGLFEWLKQGLENHAKISLNGDVFSYRREPTTWLSR